MKTRTLLQMENLALRNQLIVPSPEYAKAPPTEGNGPPLLDRNLAAVRRLADLAGDCATEDGRWLAQNLFRAFWTWKIRHGIPAGPEFPVTPEN
jgi:hypothetical protein